MWQSQFVGRAANRRESELNRVLYRNIAWTYIAIICFSQKFVIILLQLKKSRQLHCFLIKNNLYNVMPLILSMYPFSLNRHLILNRAARSAPIPAVSR